MRLRTGLTPAWVDGLEDGVRYKLRPLTGAQRLTMTQALWEHKTSTRVPADVQVDAIKASMLDWDGVCSENGTPLAFDRDIVDLLDDGELSLLFARVYELSALHRSSDPVEDEAGNSASQSK